MRLKIACTLLFFVLTASLSGCGYLVAGGAGATGGYIMRDQGYEVQSPVKKESKDEEQKETTE